MIKARANIIATTADALRARIGGPDQPLIQKMTCTCVCYKLQAPDFDIVLTTKETKRMTADCCPKHRRNCRPMPRWVKSSDPSFFADTVVDLKRKRIRIHVLSNHLSLHGNRSIRRARKQKIQGSTTICLA
jgi:hypothetical protein